MRADEYSTAYTRYVFIKIGIGLVYILHAIETISKAYFVSTFDDKRCDNCTHSYCHRSSSSFSATATDTIHTACTIHVLYEQTSNVMRQHGCYVLPIFASVFISRQLTNFRLLPFSIDFSYWFVSVLMYIRVSVLLHHFTLK